MLVKIERFINRRIYMILDISISGGRMILDMQGKPIEELDDLDLSDVQLTGLESIARERPKIIEAVLPDYDVAARRNVIAYLAALAIGSSNVYADSPNPLFKQMRSLLNRVSSDDLRRRTLLTPEDEIGEAGNTGTLAKGWHHLAFSLKVPPYAEPNNQYTTRNERTGQAATAHSADPARFAEYCVVGKNVDGKRVKICNYSVNYRQGKEYDTATWEKDKEFRRFLGGLRQELSMPVAEFRGLMQSVLYYYPILLIEGKLKKRFDGKLSASRADSYLEKLSELW